MHKFFIWMGCAILFLGMTAQTRIGLAQPQINFVYGYTNHQASGNRVVDGHGTFPNVTQIEHNLDVPQTWLVGIVYGDEPLWIVANADGGVNYLTTRRDACASGKRPAESTHVQVHCTIAPLPPGSPPIVRFGQTLRLLRPPADASRLSHVIQLYTGGQYIDTMYIKNNGDIALGDSSLHTTAMLDARLVVSADGLVAVYSDPTTNRYIHGIMGDDIEAASISIMDASVGDLRLVSKIELAGTSVFEGLSPIWADVDGDGEDDLITTVSDDGLGAQIVIMQSNGDIIARGPAIGQSHRWRHQIAWAALGENGEVGLLEVRTPHIGGEVGFFTLSESGDELERIASVQGYTSHVIGSRNLDMAVVGDFNGDGQMEVALPTQDRMRIVGLQISGGTFEEVWSLPLDGPLSSNLAAVTLPDGSLALAAGTETGTVYLWLPA